MIIFQSRSEGYDEIKGIRNFKGNKQFIVNAHDFKEPGEIEEDIYVELDWYIRSTDIPVEDVHCVWNAFDESDKETLTMYALKYSR